MRLDSVAARRTGEPAGDCLPKSAGGEDRSGEDVLGRQDRGAGVQRRNLSASGANRRRRDHRRHGESAQRGKQLSICPENGAQGLCHQPGARRSGICRRAGQARPGNRPAGQGGLGEIHQAQDRGRSGQQARHGRSQDALRGGRVRTGRIPAQAAADTIGKVRHPCPANGHGHLCQRAWRTTRPASRADRGRGRRARAAIDHPLARSGTHAGQNPRPRIESRSTSHRHAGQPARARSRISGNGRLGGQPARTESVPRRP